VDKGIIDMEGNKSGKRLKIHTFPLVIYMGKCTEELDKMKEKNQTENEGMASPAPVGWQLNP
jgi:hypothetical protein